MERGILERLTIKQLLLAGIVGLMAVFVMLGVAWVTSVAQLGAMKERLFMDAQSLQADHRLELAITGASREELLWRATGDPNHRQAGAAHLREAGRLLGELRRYVTAPAEIRLIESVEARYRAWHRLILPAADAVPPDREALYRTTDDLVAAVHQHRDLNARQMQQTVRDGLELEAWVRREMMLLLPLALLALGLGGMELWTRIMRPTLRLAQAARDFGAGDLEARAQVEREDEINDVCRTFNAMADAIRDREKDHSHFVTMLAQDFKDPLTVIGGAAHLIRGKAVRPEEQDVWVDRILRSTSTLEDKVADLLDGVRAQSGPLELRREEFDLAKLAAEVVRAQNEVLRGGDDAAAQPPTLRFEGEASCLLRGDRRRFERVLVNLLTNAIKNSPPGSEVRLTLWRRGTEIRLTVEDQGEDVAPHDLKRVLQPFTRIESTPHRMNGIGLGLFAVRNVIEAHGGTLDVRSRPGHGTTVEILLKKDGMKNDEDGEGMNA